MWWSQALQKLWMRMKVTQTTANLSLQVVCSGAFGALSVVFHENVVH